MKSRMRVIFCLFFSLFLACDNLLQTAEERQAENHRKALAQAKIVQENMFHGTLNEVQCRLSSGTMMAKGSDDALTGAAVGWFLFGKTGAVVGAVAGAESNQQSMQIPGKIESLVFKVVGDDGLEYTFEIVEKKNCISCRPPYARFDDISKDALIDMKIGAKIKIPSLTKLDRLATVDSRLIYYEEENISGL